jgi:ribosomal-protein-alanine N-acetyltransferase
MRLIRATGAHAPAMSAAHAVSFPAGWREDEFEDLLEGEGIYGFVALGEDDAPLGVVLCRVAADEMEVLTIGVVPAARGLGVARALMTAGLGAARAMGAQACFLEVAIDNIAAISLYERLDFHRAGRRVDYYDRGEAGMADAYVMRLDLSPAGP